MIKYSPCYQCEERHELCHSTCAKYHQYQHLLAEQKKNARASAEMENYLAKATIRRIGK